MSQAAQEHRSEAPERVRCAVLTVSDTRTLETDSGGATIVERLAAAGRDVADRSLLPDEPEAIRRQLEKWIADETIDVVLVTGGTGVSHRDRTFEAIRGLLERELPGFGELFRMLSFEQVGAAAMLSRATAGLVGRTAIFAMPGSVAAVRLAMDRLIVPELGHLVAQARK
jgi:molybdenum cofactor biosynthesis protein B